MEEKHHGDIGTDHDADECGIMGNKKNDHAYTETSYEKKEHIGHSQVGDNNLCGPQSRTSKDGREIMEKQKNVGQSTNPNLKKQEYLESQFLSGF
ncbi:hypothetical protein STEG23_027724 [Scotinomys teguina]